MPKAANHAKEMMTSTAGGVSDCDRYHVYGRDNIHPQEKKPEENGMSHISPRRMDKPATTSV